MTAAALASLTADQLAAKLAASWNDRPAAATVRAEIRRRRDAFIADFAGRNR
jgi:hypothetical protein